jgi:hypothetical protein
MLNKLTFIITLAISSVALVIVPKTGIAQTPLNQATIESLRNQVRLIPNQQTARSARVSDILNLGDAIATARGSSTDLRFNDYSLARLGEQAIFRFVPGTRTIDLINGTGLFLINPGQGTTTIRTPNAAAGIRGSALFTRVIPAGENGQEAITLIGALTDSGIQVCNQDASQCLQLESGQMAFFEGEELNGVYQFDLNTFLNTSSLAQGIDQVAPGLVLNEIKEALANQPTLSGTILETPDFVRMRGNLNTEFVDTEVAVVDFNFETPSFNDNQVLESITSIMPREISEVGEISGGGVTDGNFPGGGVTDGNFPGGGATDGEFPWWWCHG